MCKITVIICGKCFHNLIKKFGRFITESKKYNKYKSAERVLLADQMTVIGNDMSVKHVKHQDLQIMQIFGLTLNKCEQFATT